jgi:hypothetical protein
MKKLFSVLLYLFGTYVMCYGTAQLFIKPAWDLNYFYYADNDLLDEVLYYGFWPVYKIHKCIGGYTHIRDAEPWSFEQLKAAGIEG